MRPPFTEVSEYAAALGELVPDERGIRGNVDLCHDALNTYGGHYPNFQAVDVGDGTETEYPLGVTGEALAAFEWGYSDSFGFNVESLDNGSALNPPEFLREKRDYWKSLRSGGVTVLVFDTAPETNGARVHFRIRWGFDTVPEAHQMAVVYFAAEAKCHALAGFYRKTKDAGTGLFDGVEAADGYTTQAGNFRKQALATLGVGRATSIETAQARRTQPRLFRRHIP